MRFISAILVLFAMLCTGAQTLSQSLPAAPPTLAPTVWTAAPVVVHVNGGTLALGDNYYDPVTKRLIVPGTDYAQSWVVNVNFRNATYTSNLIPPAIVGGDVLAAGISKDGQYVYGWMDSPGSNPAGDGEGFFSPVGNPGSRTLIGFLSPGVTESHVRDMSANGIVVGDSVGTLPCYWTAATGIQQLPIPGTGGVGTSRAISANGIIGYGMFTVAGPGSEQAGAWIWGNPYALPCTNLSIGVGCSPSGLVAAGVDGFNACSWTHGTQRPIYEAGTTPLNGEARDAVDSGFCVGVGVFAGQQRGFIWHPSWPQAKTIRDYVLSRTGVDIGFDVTEASGISQWGLMLYITGADVNGGVAIQVIARP